MKQILLVEDDHDIAALLRLNLEDEGYAITHEPDGGNALQCLDCLLYTSPSPRD